MLQTSGPISTYDINVELGFERTALINICDPLPRRLAGKPSGPISLFDFYGKGMHTVTFNGYSNLTVGGQTGTNIQFRDVLPYVIPEMTVSQHTVNGWTAVFDFFAETINTVDTREFMETKAVNMPTIQYRVGSTVPETVSNLFAWYKVSNVGIKVQVNETTQVTIRFGDCYVNSDASTQYSVTDAMISEIPSKEYYVLVGFSTTSGGVVEYRLNESFTGLLTKFNPNTILYPIYEGEPVTVRYNLNGGTINGQTEITVDAKIDDTITIISDIPIKSGYTFTHWEDKLSNRYNPGDPFVVSSDKIETSTT